MLHKLIFTCLVSSLFLSYGLTAQTFQSSTTKTQLLELYSSQGCSSCPPAERWISKQLHNPDLWKTFIPVVFHVDYWDYLGWKDSFSNDLYSARQRTYHSQGSISSVYTPGMVLDGNEWRGWYRNHSLPVSINKPGQLTAILNESILKIHFEHEQPLNVNIALLGFNIKTDIKNGENRGKSFKEDFIVLDKINKFSKEGNWIIDISTMKINPGQRYALVMWINKPDNLQPLQATGGWIDNP